MPDNLSVVESVARLLKASPGDIEQEARLLESVVLLYGSQYDFINGGNDRSSTAFQNLYDALVKQRLCSPTWLQQAPQDHVLRVLQTLRLLTRDGALRRSLAEQPEALEAVAQVLQRTAAEHFSASSSPYQVEVLTECASIAKRLAGDEWGVGALVRAGAQAPLLQLLGSSDPAVVPLVLVALLGYAAHQQHYALVAGPDSLELLLRVVQHYDLPFKQLAAEVLAALARHQEVVGRLLEVNCLGRVVGLLQNGDTRLLQALLRMLCHMAPDLPAAQEMYQVGVVPLLLALLRLQPGEQVGRWPLNGERLTEVQLVCTALARLAEALDEAGLQMRQCNGVFLVGQLLLHDLSCEPWPSGDSPSLGLAPGGSAGNNSRQGRGVAAHALRTLRYLFSMERNRKLFKRLFPPDLFSLFIDIGHYNPALQPYLSLAARFRDLGPKQVAAVAAALEEINMEREGGHRVVHGYEVLELLGRGAFGAVYKARRARAESLVALKELPLAEGGLFGASDAERKAGAGRMSREVEILSSLHHPNIVQYYESFVEGQQLYIAMELVEGPSLLDHLASLSERNRRMPEQDIWQVIVAVVLALNYIHEQKRVIHRDLTPGNIVLGQAAAGLRHTKITDFGLAKCLNTQSITQSVVGTMPYTCPEIIQQERYSEKADIWSLGCVVYHMMMLRPPFDGTNPLSVASKIVEGTYDPLQDPPSGPPYSDSLKAFVTTLLTTNPDRRPDIEAVAAGIAGRLMAQLDCMHSAEESLLKQLNAERRHRRASWDVSSRKIDAYRKLAHLQQQAQFPPSSASSETASQPASPSLRRNSASLLDSPFSPTSPAPAPNPLGALAPGPHAHNVIPLAALPSGTLAPGGAAGGYVLGRAVSAGTVSIPQSKLRPVADPGAQILQQLHKVMWVEQLPPGTTRDPRRRMVELFRRNLFSSHSNPGSIKVHLTKLISGESEVIQGPQGPLDFGGPSPGAPPSQRDGCLTYLQLQQMLEALLDEKGYYNATASGVSTPTP